MLSFWKAVEKSLTRSRVGSGKCVRLANCSRSSTTTALKPTRRASGTTERAMWPAPNTWTVGLPIGSTKTSTIPPQASPPSSAARGLNLKLRRIGRSVAITSRASAHTSASVQPPPMVPTVVPSLRTSIFADSLPGVEPVEPITVARAPFSPCSTSRMISL